MIPLLRRHVRGCGIGYWGGHLLPLARLMAAQSEAAAAAAAAAGTAKQQQQHQKAISQACHVLEVQLWNTLPSFCSWAMDLPQTYALHVKDMAAAFQNRQDLRSTVCQALERMYLQVGGKVVVVMMMMMMVVVVVIWQ